jgi:hypothetical protein
MQVKPGKPVLFSPGVIENIESVRYNISILAGNERGNRAHFPVGVIELHAFFETALFSGHFSACDGSGRIVPAERAASTKRYGQGEFDSNECADQGGRDTTLINGRLFHVH